MSINQINNYNATNAAGYDGAIGGPFIPATVIQDIKERIIYDYYIGNEMAYLATAKGMMTDLKSLSIMYAVATRADNRVPRKQINEEGTIITRVDMDQDVMTLCNNIKRGLKIDAKQMMMLEANGNFDIFREIYQQQENQRDIENINISTLHTIQSGIAKENTGFNEGYTRKGLFLGSQTNPYDLDAAARNSKDVSRYMDSLSRYLLRLVTLAGSYGLKPANNTMLPTMAAVSSLTFVVPWDMYPYVMEMYARLTRYAARPEDYPLVTGKYMTFNGFNILLSQYLKPLRNPQGSGIICPVMLLDTNMVAHEYLPLYIDNERPENWKSKVWETEIVWGSKLLRKTGGILGQVLINDALTSRE